MTDTASALLVERPERSWLNRKQAARYLAQRGCPISVRTLERWAANNNEGRGPSFTAVRWSFVRYFKDDLDSWITREVRRVE